MKTYWAAEQGDKFVSRLRQRVIDYRANVGTAGRLALWKRAARTFYGLDADGGFTRSHYVTFDGDAGELVRLRGNVFRALVRQLHVMTTGSRPSFECRPVAYDATTTEIVTLGNAILDKYLNDRLEQTLSDALLYAILYGEGWIPVLWDDSAGEAIGMDPQTGRVVHEGDVYVEAFRPDQIIRDPDRDNLDHDWVIVQRQHNRWDLAAQYPQYADKIMNASGDWGSGSFGEATIRAVIRPTARTDSDQVWVYELYHRPTDAMPEGRCTWVVGDTIIADRPNPYKCLPVICLSSGREPGMAFGYGESWDLLALQSAFDSVLSQAITTRENFGLRNIFVQTGSMDSNPISIGQGLRLLTGTAPPVPIDLADGAVESAANALDLLRGIMQMLTGLNDAAVGDAGKSSSGAALAMMHQLASQFNSGLQRTYAGAFEKVMTQILENLKMFATTDRIIHIAGSNRAPLVKRFKGEDLSALDGVVVEMGNAAMRTTAMRKELAEKMLSGGVLTSPEQFLEVIATGRLEPILEGPRANETRAERMIELVLEGRGYTPLATDPHKECIEGLVRLLDDPDIREDPAVPLAIQALITKHATMWAEMSASPMGVTLLAATGQQPSPAAGMMMGAMPGAPMPPNPGDPQQGAEPQPPQGPPNTQPGPLPRGPVPTEDGGMGTDAASMPQLPAESAQMVQ